MLKILVDTKNIQPDITMFFDLNQGPYSIVDVADSNVVVIDGDSNCNKYDTKLKLYFEIFHNYEGQIKNIHYNYYDDIISDRFYKSNCYSITNAVDYTSGIENNYILHNDFLFNRTKAYYSNFKFTNKPWYYVDGGYILPETTSAAEKKNIYIAPNKTHKLQIQNGTRSCVYRNRLVELLLEKYINIGYVGNYQDSDLIIPSQHDYPSYTLDQLTQLTVIKKPSTGYSPVHNEYYKDTFISVYGETNEIGNTIAVTEKTYDPLIKGHFILPFSNCGFLKHLTSLGFKLPTFIDYSYDTIVDDDARYRAYATELSRILSIPLDEWRTHWDENYIDIIKFNQDLFFIKPYDTIDLNKLM